VWTELRPGETREDRWAVKLPGGLKLEAPWEVELIATYTFAGGERTDQVKHRFLVLPPVTLELGVAEQINPLTRELGLKLSATNIADAEISGQVSLALPEGWQSEAETVDLVVPPRETHEITFTAILPENAAADKYDLAAVASYSFGGKEYETKAEHEFELKGNLLVAKCKYAAHPPDLDGQLDDDCWKSATRLADFMRIDGSAPATDQTEGFIARDDTSLYVAVRCHEALLNELVANFKGDGASVWEDDSIEIWIDVGHRHKGGIQLVANCIGAKYSRPAGLRWEALPGREANAWTLEIAIPWASLERAPKAGELWGFNLCRSRQAKGLAQREHSAWSCTYGGFARIENLGHIVFPPR